MADQHWLAHLSAEDGREQTILEHLTGTAELCSQFAAAFGAKEQGCLGDHYQSKIEHFGTKTAYLPEAPLIL